MTTRKIPSPEVARMNTDPLAMIARVGIVTEPGRIKHISATSAHVPETVIEPLFSWQGIGRFLDNEPEPQEFILENCLPAKITGAIFATGGVGKTTLALQLSSCMATGTPFGPFIPTRPMKVLFIGGEDSEDIFHRRLYNSVPAMGMRADGGSLAATKEALLRENLEVVSMVGTDRPITELDEAGNPRTTKVFRRLQETIRAFDRLDVLIIDPKSRFDGLNENDNSHATFFVSCLERLVADHGITVLFSHHESKAQVKDGEVKSSSGRGASALRDGVRWALSLGEMSDKEAEKFDVEAVDYIEAAISKNNYGPKWTGMKYFRREKDGVLFPVNLATDRIDSIMDALVKGLATTRWEFTKRDLCKGSNDTARNNAVKKIIDKINEEFSIKRATDIRRTIEQAIYRGKLTEKETSAGTKSKKILIVHEGIMARYKSEREWETVVQDEPDSPQKSGPRSGRT